MKKKLVRPLVGAIRKTLLTGVIGVSQFTICQVATAQNIQHYSIPATSLDQALQLFNSQSNVALQFNANDLKPLQSEGLNGDYTVEDGLKKLLEQHHLQAVKTEKGYVLNSLSVSAQANQKDNSTQLPSIKAISNNETTEGTGKYAADVNVTALPFSATLRETPQSVSVITNQLIQDKKINNFLEAVESTPGIAVRQYESNRATINSRGIDINDYLIDGIPTTTVFDSRYTAGEIFNDLSIYDRVEIVRGSAGLTTGTGDPSAVVNLVRKKADSREFKGSVSTEVGSWSHYGATADISTPITKSGDTRARIVANYQDKDSYIDLLHNNTQTLYATVEQDITNQTKIVAGISHQQQRDKGVMWGGLPAWAGAQMGSWTPLANWEENKTTAADWTRWDVDYTNWFVGGEHNFDNGWKAKINYSLGERDSTAKMLMVFPFVSPTGASGGIKSAGIYDTIQSHEGVNLQVDGDFNLFNRTHQLAFGTNYTTQKSESYNRVGSGLTNGNIYTWTGLNYPEPTFGPRMLARKDEEENKSIYAAGRFTIFDPLKVIVGARYVDYDLTHTAANMKQSKVTFDKVIPYGGVIYDIIPQLSVYTSYTRILKPQNDLDVNGNVLKPVKGNNKEVGFKGQFFDNRLNASIAWFKTTRDNQKVYDRMVAGEDRYKESKDAQAKGYEIELSGEILPNWQIMAGYTKVNATYYNNLSDATTIAYNEKLDATLIPEKQFKLFTSYRLSGSLSGLTIGGGVTWQSATYQANPTSFFGFPFYQGVATRQGAYAVADFMARYQFSQHVSAQLNINNVFNKQYYGISEDALQVYRQPPRSALLTLKYQF